MPKPAKTSASASRAPASQQEIPGVSIGGVERDEELTNALFAEFGQEDDRPERPAKGAKPQKPKPAADPEGDDPADEDGDPEGNDDPNAGETAEERRARLQQGEGESDEDYAARLEAEGVDPAELAETEEERQERLQQGEGESDEDYAARLAAEGVDPTEVEPVKPKVPKNLQKRFGELTTQLKEKDAEIARLKAGSQAAAAERTYSSVEEEVRGASTPEALAKLQQRFEYWEEQAIANPDGLELPGVNGGQPVTYTAEQMKGILLNARRALRAIPAQERFIEQLAAQDAAAFKAFPAYRDANSPLSKAYASIVERAPGLVRSVPDLRLFVADALRGRAIRLAGKGGRADLPGRPAVTRGAQPPVTRQPSRGAAPRGRAEEYKAKLARAEETGSEEDLAAALESRL